MQFKNPLIAVAAALEAAAFSLRSSCAEDTTNAVDVTLETPESPAVGTPTPDVGTLTLAPVEPTVVDDSASAEGSSDASNVVALEPAAVDEQSSDDTRFDVVVNMLNDERYSLRTTVSLVQKSGMTREEIYQELDNRGIDYVIMHRRRDGAELLGLDSRN